MDYFLTLQLIKGITRKIDKYEYGLQHYLHYYSNSTSG